MTGDKLGSVIRAALERARCHEDCLHWRPSADACRECATRTVYYALADAYPDLDPANKPLSVLDRLLVRSRRRGR